MSIESLSVQCPYCGEIIEIEVEATSTGQDYIEDCSVCCRPIQFHVVQDEDGPQVTATRSD